MNRRKQVLIYLFFDFISAAIAWALFYIFRKVHIEPQVFGYEVDLEFGVRFILGITLVPLFWLLLYYLSGFYKEVYRKSRLSELGQTFFISLAGVTVLFFALILDDVIVSYKSYYLSYLVLFSLHFSITYLFRLIITSITLKRIRERKIGFNTLLIGSNVKAVEIFKELNDQKVSSGNRILGFVSIKEKKHYQLQEYTEHFGSLSDIHDILKQKKIDEVIIAIESSEHDKINRILNSLSGYHVVVKAIPDIYDILTGRVKIDTLLGTPLIQISHDLMPVLQENLKRTMDVVLAVFALIITLPLNIVIILGIKLTSRGPVIYSHERIGRYGKPFMIYKFRSMYQDAEKDGPKLTKKNDERLTPIGRFLRKHKFDEIPNFWNVIKGDMSLVGPRPERKYFIDQIIPKAPHYVHLHKVRPGITSWGQVKYGYAENVEQMIKRLRYDILYIENMSLYVDLKILVYTIITIFKGRGV